jgi:hypothetical protein
MNRVLSVAIGAGLVLCVGATAQAQYPGQPGGTGYYQPPADEYGQPPPHDYGQPHGRIQPGGVFMYVGIHPIPYDVGNGFCTIQGPHNHQYQPFDSYLFRQVNGSYYFVGDPWDFGYTQQQFTWYRGEHPVPVEYGDGYCYMSWPHRHHYAPTAQFMPYYRMQGGYYVYRGPYGESYHRWRDTYSHYYRDYYRSNYYGNRYYRVRPAPVYRGVEIRVGGPGPGWGYGHGRGYGHGPRVYGVPQPVPPPVVVQPAPPVPVPAPAYQPRPYYAPAPAAPPPAPAYGGGGGYVPPPPPAPVTR